MVSLIAWIFAGAIFTVLTYIAIAAYVLLVRTKNSLLFEEFARKNGLPLVVLGVLFGPFTIFVFSAALLFAFCVFVKVFCKSLRKLYSDLIDLIKKIKKE